MAPWDELVLHMWLHHKNRLNMLPPSPMRGRGRSTANGGRVWRDTGVRANMVRHTMKGREVARVQEICGPEDQNLIPF